MFFSFLSSSSSAISLHTFFLSSFYTSSFLRPFLSSFLRPFLPSFLRPFLLSFLLFFIHSFISSFLSSSLPFSLLWGSSWWRHRGYEETTRCQPKHHSVQIENRTFFKWRMHFRNIRTGKNIFSYEIVFIYIHCNFLLISALLVLPFNSFFLSLLLSFVPSFHFILLLSSKPFFYRTIFLTPALLSFSSSHHVSLLPLLSLFLSAISLFTTSFHVLLTSTFFSFSFFLSLLT